MSRKMYCGLSILIVIFIAGGVFLLVKQQRELVELRQGAAESDKLLEEHQKLQTVADNKPPRPAQEGFEWEWHGDHWHEMPVAQSEAPDKATVSKPVHQPVTTYKDNGEYVEIDYSVFDKPEELIARIGEIMLNPEKYSTAEYDRAAQESDVLGSKIRDGYYGEGEYRDKLRELKNKTYGDALLKRGFGISREELRAMIRGEIPPIVVPIDPKVVEEDANKGSDK